MHNLRCGDKWFTEMSSNSAEAQQCAPQSPTWVKRLSRRLQTRVPERMNVLECFSPSLHNNRYHLLERSELVKRLLCPCSLWLANYSSFWQVILTLLTVENMGLIKFSPLVCFSYLKAYLGHRLKFHRIVCWAELWIKRTLWLVNVEGHSFGFC